MTIYKQVSMFITFQKTQGISYPTFDAATIAYLKTLDSAHKKLAAPIANGK